MIEKLIRELQATTLAAILADIDKIDWAELRFTYQEARDVGALQKACLEELNRRFG